MRRGVSLLAVLACVVYARPAAAGDADEVRERVRAMDITNTPALRDAREAIRERHALGGSAPAPFTASDLGRATVMRDVSGASWRSGSSIGDVFGGTQDVVDAFFALRQDSDVDFVVVIQDWLNIALLFAFYMPLENDVTGIGYQRLDSDEVFDLDPSTPIEGYLWLNGVQGLLDEQFAGILFGQELGHRWGAYVYVDTGSGPDGSVLGRDDAHWSWYLDSDWSWMEGNDWVDAGGGDWSTDVDGWSIDEPHYSPLDLYLMGLVTSAEVPAFTLIVPATGGTPPASTQPDAWLGAEPTTVAGTARVLGIDDVIAAEGPRFPAAGGSPTDFDLAVIYVLRQNDRVTAQEIETLEGVLDGFTEMWELDTGGRSTVSFGPGGAGNAPPILAAIAGPPAVKEGVLAAFDASSATDPDGDALTFHWRWDADDSGAGAFDEGDAVQSHAFSGEGERTIEVAVRDARGAETIVPFTLLIEPGSGGAAGCGCRLVPAGGDRSRVLAPAALLAAALLAVVSRRSVPLRHSAREG